MCLPFAELSMVPYYHFSIVRYPPSPFFGGSGGSTLAFGYFVQVFTFSLFHSLITRPIKQWVLTVDLQAAPTQGLT